MLVDEGIVHFRDIFHRSILEENVDPFVVRIIGCVDGFTREYKIIQELIVNPQFSLRDPAFFPDEIPVEFRGL